MSRRNKRNKLEEITKEDKVKRRMEDLEVFGAWTRSLETFDESSLTGTPIAFEQFPQGEKRCGIIGVVDFESHMWRLSKTGSQLFTKRDGKVYRKKGSMKEHFRSFQFVLSGEDGVVVGFRPSLEEKMVKTKHWDTLLGTLSSKTKTELLK